MTKPRIGVFSGPNATIANSPPLITSNKGRLPGERTIPGRFDVLVPQFLYEPVTVKIRKFSAHPLEEDASEVYHDDGKEYYEVTLKPEDGPYNLPYMARRRDGSPNGTPFEAEDKDNPEVNFGGRQSLYPEASRIFLEIDRTTYGRDEEGKSNVLDRKADYAFIRSLPPAGYTKKGERAGLDFFPYTSLSWSKDVKYRDLARTANSVQTALRNEEYDGAIWLQGSSYIEETLYWLSLLVDTQIPIVGNAGQRPHGQLSADGDRNIVDAVDYILSGEGKGLGVVGIQDQQIFAARDIKKADGRPGGYKATGAHGGVLGTVKSSKVTIWYAPRYKHTSSSDVNLSRLPEQLELADDSLSTKVRTIQVKNADGTLKGESIPHVHIVKYAAYSEEDVSEDPSEEVDIMARIEKALVEEGSESEGKPKLHGFVLEGSSSEGRGSNTQTKALSIAALSGLPVVRVGRADPGGSLVTNETDMSIEGNNLDANKARLLLMASMLKLGRLPRAKNPRAPTAAEKEAVLEQD